MVAKTKNKDIVGWYIKYKHFNHEGVSSETVKILTANKEKALHMVDRFIGIRGIDVAIKTISPIYDGSYIKGDVLYSVSK